jgi:hypothetical protein
MVFDAANGSSVSAITGTHALPPPRGDEAGEQAFPTLHPNPPPSAKRFYGSVLLDATRATRVGCDAGRIAEEVIAHLAGLPDAKVKVTLEIDVALPEGAPENVVRTVTENARTLKFANQGFEKE